MWLNIGDGESAVGGMGVVILREGGVVLEEVNSWNRISIDLHTPTGHSPQPSDILEQSYQGQ